MKRMDGRSGLGMRLVHQNAILGMRLVFYLHVLLDSLNGFLSLVFHELLSLFLLLFHHCLLLRENRQGAMGVGKGGREKGRGEDGEPEK